MGNYFQPKKMKQITVLVLLSLIISLATTLEIVVNRDKEYQENKHKCYIRWAYHGIRSPIRAVGKAIAHTVRDTGRVIRKGITNGVKGSVHSIRDVGRFGKNTFRDIQNWMDTKINSK